MVRRNIDFDRCYAFLEELFPRVQRNLETQINAFFDGRPVVFSTSLRHSPPHISLYFDLNGAHRDIHYQKRRALVHLIKTVAFIHKLQVREGVYAADIRDDRVRGNLLYPKEGSYILKPNYQEFKLPQLK